MVVRRCDKKRLSIHSNANDTNWKIVNTFTMLTVTFNVIIQQENKNESERILNIHIPWNAFVYSQFFWWI